MRRRTLLLVLLLLAPPAHAAALEGDLRAEEATLDGARFEGPALFFGATDAGDRHGGATFSLTADRVDVVVHRQRYVSAADVDVNPDAADGGGSSQDPPVRHDHAQAATLRTGPEAFVQAEGLEGPGGAPTFTVAGAVEHLRPRDDLDFRREADTGSEWQPSRRGPWPNLESLRAGDDPLVLRGDLVVTVYDMDLRLDTEDEQATYRTGRVPQNETTAGPLGTAASDGEVRRMDLTLHNATLTYQPHGRPHQFNAHGGTLSGDGTVRLDGAEGTLRTGAGTVAVQGRLDLDARFQATVGLDDGMLHLALESTNVRSASVDGTPLAVAAPATPLARTRWSLASLSLALLVAVAGGLAWRVHARRMDPDTLVTAAGWALGEGEPRRAARWARRVLARDDGDRDAALLHVVALYHQGRHGEAVAWLADWTSRHGDDPVLAMALGLGVLETDGPERAAVHVGRALEADPSLREVLGARHA